MSARRWVLALLLSLCTAFARAASPPGIEVYEFGTYQGGIAVDGGVTAEGARHDSFVSDITHLNSARTVIAVIGARFGFRYRLTGADYSQVLPLKMVIAYPEPGVIGLDPKKHILHDEYATNAGIGAENFGVYTFERKSDLVRGSGRWIWQGKRKLTEQRFTVVLPPTS